MGSICVVLDFREVTLEKFLICTNHPHIEYIHWTIEITFLINLSVYEICYFKVTNWIKRLKLHNKIGFHFHLWSIWKLPQSGLEIHLLSRMLSSLLKSNCIHSTMCSGSSK